MTTNAVNYKTAMSQIDVKRAENDIKKIEAELKREGIEINREELLEAIRSHKVNEYLKQQELDEKKWKDKMDVLVAAGSALLGKGGAGALLNLNDESWHSKMRDTYDQATKLSFSLKGGQPVNTGWSTKSAVADNVKPTTNDFEGEFYVPKPNGGYAIIKYYPVFSVQSQSLEAGETQNVVRTIWNSVRSANSGYINGYDQSDLFQFVYCSSALAEVIATVLRPFNYMDAKRKNGNNYTSNDYVLINAMTGNNADKVIENKPAYIQILNSKFRSVNAQKLPIGFDLTKRRLVLNKNIFTHDGNKDEFYIFLPKITYKYDEENSKCKAVNIDYADLFSSPTKLGAFLEQLISPLINGNATSTMAGDIKKAYPKNVSTLASLKYTLKGDVYSSDEHILEAVRNANVLPSMDTGDIDEFDIKQGINANTDTYVYAGTLNARNEMTYVWSPKYLPANDNEDDGTMFADQIGLDADHPELTFYPTNLLDIKKDKPEPYDIMAGTRFKVSRYVTFTGETTEDEDYVKSQLVVTGCGTEIICGMEFCYFNDDAGFKTVSESIVDLTDKVRTNFLDYVFTVKDELSNLINFRYCPYIPDCKILTWDHDSVHSSANWFPLGRGNYNMRNITRWELDQLNIASFGSLLMTESDYVNNSSIE